MALPPGVSSHHTVWVHHGTDHPAHVRYAVDGERLVCFGDGELSSVPDGTHVSASVHEIAGGPQLASFGATLRTIPPEQVGTNTLVEVIGHVPLGRTTAEVESGIERYRNSRRIVELVP
ncbi:MAG: hypothetical protein U0V73_05550 [Acidimicrobiia bacterium]